MKHIYTHNRLLIISIIVGVDRRFYERGNEVKKKKKLQNIFIYKYYFTQLFIFY